MKTRKRIRYWVVSSLATLAILASAGAYVFIPPPKGSLARVKWEYARDEARYRPAIDARYKQAKSEAERQAILEVGWDLTRSGFQRALAWAAAHPNDPKVIDALTWPVLEVATGYYFRLDSEIERIYDLLTEKKAFEGEQIGLLCAVASSTSYASPAAKRFLATALEQGSNKTIRGISCLELGRHYTRIASIRRNVDDPLIRDVVVKAHSSTPRGFLDQIRQADPDALDREAEVYFERVVNEFGDVTYPKPRAQSPLGEIARGELFELRNLVVGNVAPEIEGQDLDGRPLRLSDFRGKVVALAFWATWCGPCMGNVPKERELVRRLEKKPFVLLGINGDADRGTAKSMAAKEHVNWQSWWDGQNGPIAERWSVSGWPTHYVLDPNGVIRYKNPQGDHFYRAIERVVAEAEAGTK
jgi:peroxiredoxin